ncbi:MAG TPA: cytosine deaminase, partial [Reyranella sp.]
MKRMGFAAIPERPHYWLADARVQACLIKGSPLGKPDFEGLVRGDIEIKDGRIAAIAPLGTAPAGAVDLRGG